MQVADNLQDYTLIPLEDIQTNVYTFAACLPLDTIDLHLDIKSSRNSLEAKGQTSRLNGFVMHISKCRTEKNSAY